MSSVRKNALCGTFASLVLSGIAGCGKNVKPESQEATQQIATTTKFSLNSRDSTGAIGTIKKGIHTCSAILLTSKMALASQRCDSSASSTADVTFEKGGEQYSVRSVIKYIPPPNAVVSSDLAGEYAGPMLVELESPVLDAEPATIYSGNQPLGSQELTVVSADASVDIDLLYTDGSRVLGVGTPDVDDGIILATKNGGKQLYGVVKSICRSDECQAASTASFGARNIATAIGAQGGEYFKWVEKHLPVARPDIFIERSQDDYRLHWDAVNHATGYRLRAYNGSTGDLLTTADIDQSESGHLLEDLSNGLSCFTVSSLKQSWESSESERRCVIHLHAGETNPYHNSTEPLDVNNDGCVRPADALAVINFLNRYGSQSLTSNANYSNFPDVNADGLVSPIDGLMIINRLNREGEFCYDN